MNKKITVIIPIYNGEKYLKRCVNSILNQTLGDEYIKILLLNDGSRDNSLAIANELSKQNSDVIQVINKENTGVADTRNLGIELAKTEWLTFVDQDDYLELDFFENYFSVSELEKFDVIVGGFQRTSSELNVLRIVHVYPGLEKKISVTATWAKIHRSKFIKKNQIRFYSTALGEDIPFTLKETELSHGRLKNIDYVGYNWFLNEDSVSNTVHKKMSDTIKDAGLDIIVKSIDMTKRNKYTDHFIITNAIGIILNAKTSSEKEFIDFYNCLFLVIDRADLKYHISVGKGDPILDRLIHTVFYALHKLKLVNIFAKFYVRN